MKAAVGNGFQFYLTKKGALFYSYFLFLQESQRVQKVQKVQKWAKEMSDLVVLCVPKPFTPFMLRNMDEETSNDCTEMSSFNESRAKAYMVESNQQKFQTFHQKHLSRIYPKVK